MSAGRVLVVDDELATVTFLAIVLRDVDFEVRVATSGRIALLALFAEEPYDVLVTDMYMPDLDGLALLRETTKLKKKPACILLTGDGSVDVAEKAAAAGAFEYLVKPINRIYLIDAVRRAVEEARSRGET